MRRLKLLTIVAALAATIVGASAATENLTATVTRASRLPYTGGAVDYLMVVDNKSDRAYSQTEWSCVFFDGDTPVQEATAFVEKVCQHPNGEKPNDRI